VTATLAPLDVLLGNLARDLELEVLPHVDGLPFGTVLGTIESLRAIAGTVSIDDVPNYCAVADCHLIARGPADLCVSHLIEFALARRVQP
jgi:hypothetical protein